MAAKKSQGAVKVIGLTSKVIDLLTITKLIAVFDTYDTEPEALSSFMAAV
jgi:hypothetical protein